MARLADYPFSPHHENEPWHFVGIHKCRAFRDDKMRRAVFEAMCLAAGEPIEDDEKAPNTTERHP